MNSTLKGTSTVSPIWGEKLTLKAFGPQLRCSEQMRSWI